MYKNVFILPVSDLVETVSAELLKKQVCTLRVRGNSMFPFLRDGRDLVTLRAFDPDDLKPGVIVLFKYRTKYLLHRIIKQKGANYYLRGDNNWSFRLETCTFDDVIGVVVAVERNGRSMISCTSRKWCFCSFLWMKSHCLRVALFMMYRFVKKQIIK